MKRILRYIKTTFKLPLSWDDTFYGAILKNEFFLSSFKVFMHQYECLSKSRQEPVQIIGHTN